MSRTDTNNQLLTTTFNYGGTSSVPYPVNPYWVNNITDPRGQKTTFTRDSNNQITKVAYPDGTYETFSYNSFGQVTYHLKTDGSSYTAQYDGSGNLNQSTNSFNSSANKYTYYYYDSLDRLSQVKDFDGHNTWYTYNGRHLLTQYKHDDGTHVDYAYDVYGNQTSVSDELQHVTLIAYDNHRRPTSVQVPVNAGNNTTRTTTFTYERGSDTTGNAHTKRGFGTETLDSGKQIKRVYTGNGHLHSVTKGYGNSDATTDTYFYDGVGHLSAMVDANNFTQAAYAYDALERRSTLTDANGHVTTWNYYAAGSGAYAGWLQSKQAPGPTMGGTATTEYLSYDAVGHLLSSQDPLGNPEGRSYDANGRLSSLSDSKGSYTFGYDALARRKSLTFPDASTQLWTYDPAGNLLTYTNRAGNVKTWQYDDRNRKTRYDWSNGAAVSVAYSYDSASRMTEVQNAWADLRYTYDDSGLPLSEVDTNYLANSCVNTTGFTYDKDGNVTGVEYPSGDNPTYSYDDQNRCYAFNGYSLLTFQGEWVTNRLLGNNLSTQYFYQPNWRVYEVWQHHGKYDPNLSTFPSSNISDRIYGYAPDSQMTWEMRQPDNGASGSALEDGRGENFEYASNGNMNGFSMLYPNTYQNTNNQDDSTANPSNFSGAPGAGGSGSYVNTYRYDGAGNRITATQMGSAAINYTADAEDRYTSFAYDANGDAVSAGTGWTYAYDAEGRMTSAVRQSDGYGIQFEYDGLGRLIYQGDAQPKIFCYAGKQRIEERAFANNASLYRYWFDAPGSDSMVCRYSSSTGALLLYQYDALGNTTHVSDGNGNIVEQYLYDAYGTPSVYNKAGSYLGQTSTVDNRYLFHGASAYEWVPLPGLYYCRARMYLPVHGRWLQPDPSGFKGGDVNLYRYCANDPVDCVDYSGKFTSFSSAANHLGYNDDTSDAGGNLASSVFIYQLGANVNDNFHVNGADAFINGGKDATGAALSGDPNDLGQYALGIVNSFTNGVAKYVGGQLFGAVFKGVYETITDSPYNPTQSPAASPTQSPTADPTQSPAASPTQSPTADPTQSPAASPTQSPTADPTNSTNSYIGDINGLNSIAFSMLSDPSIPIDSVGLDMFTSGSLGGTFNIHFLGGYMPVPLK